MSAAPVRSLLVTAGSTHRQPWWWNDIDHGVDGCVLDHETILVENGRLGRLLSWQSAGLLWRVARLVIGARGRYDYVYTFENGWVTFAIAFIQTLTFLRRPKHVILQFIMRERQPTLASRLKYAFMTWCFSSVYLCICSSRKECDYYAGAFGWPASKLAYVPFHSDPRLLEIAATDGDYVIAAGRTLRDYPTLIEAFRGLDAKLLVVAGRHSPGLENLPPNVSVRQDIPGPELMALIAGSMAVAVPLEPRRISTGQSVILQAMTIGKPVVATRLDGTEDYIDDGTTGLLVPPNDPGAMRDALRRLTGVASLRTRLGHAARARVLEQHLPRHYARMVVAAVTSARRSRRAEGDRS